MNMSKESEITPVLIKVSSPGYSNGLVILYSEEFPPAQRTL